VVVVVVDLRSLSAVDRIFDGEVVQTEFVGQHLQVFWARFYEVVPNKIAALLDVLRNLVERKIDGCHRSIAVLSAAVDHD
jgi:hypothetical protein